MSWKQDAKKYSFDMLPKEACGLIAIIGGKEEFYPCKNIADSTMEFFAIDPDDYAKCEDTGEIIGVFHSHPNSVSSPSEADILSCNYLKLSWHIYSPQYDSWSKIEPEENVQNPLIGRKFVWGVQDCWALIKDWYDSNKNIKLKEWQRPKSLKEFEKNPLFEICAEKTGFKEITDGTLLVGDVLLMEGMYKRLNHVALYIGDNTILHHSIGKLSCRELYDLEYQQLTKKIYRYAY